MLHIILLILKIIGIVLLCILGILLLLILCALFVPLRYRIEVNREDEKDSPPVEVYVKITWFLHLINILIRYPADIIVRARILIFTIFRLPQQESEKQGPSGKDKGQKRNKKAKKETEKEIEKETVGEAAKETGKEAKGEAKKEREKNVEIEVQCEKSPQGKETCGKAERIDTPLTAGLENQPENLQECRQQNEEISEGTDKYPPTGKISSLIEKIIEFINKIKQAIEKIKGFFKNIQYTIRNLCDKIKSTLDNIQYYREVLESEPFKQSANLCKDEIGLVLRKLKPDKFEADIIVGMDDPASTGEILAFYGMLYPMIGQTVRLAGDFASEGTHISGWLYIRGKIRAFTFLRAAIKIYFNKDIKKLIKLFKKEAV